jgi:hypothetical protein
MKMQGIKEVYAPYQISLDNSKKWLVNWISELMKAISDTATEKQKKKIKAKR